MNLKTACDDFSECPAVSLKSTFVSSAWSTSSCVISLRNDATLTCAPRPLRKTKERENRKSGQKVEKKCKDREKCMHAVPMIWHALTLPPYTQILRGVSS